MNKNKTYLAWHEIITSVGALLLLMGIEFIPGLLFALVMGNFNKFWVVSTVWIVSFQLMYLTYNTTKALQKQFKAYDDIKQAIKDALDVANTEESLNIEVEENVRPN
jgi:hypothetical protein